MRSGIRHLDADSKVSPSYFSESLEFLFSWPFLIATDFSSDYFNLLTLRLVFYDLLIFFSQRLL